MSYNAEKLQNELPNCGINFDSDSIPMPRDKPIKSRIENGELIVSAENGDAIADYYNEFNLGEFGICKDLHKWAGERGMYWEWVNTAQIALCY